MCASSNLEETASQNNNNSHLANEDS